MTFAWVGSPMVARARLHMTEERISVLEDILAGSSTTEKKKKKNITAKDCGTTAKGKPEGVERKK